MLEAYHHIKGVCIHCNQEIIIILQLNRKLIHMKLQCEATTFKPKPQWKRMISLTQVLDIKSLEFMPRGKFLVNIILIQCVAILINSFLLIFSAGVHNKPIIS